MLSLSDQLNTLAMGLPPEQRQQLAANVEEFARRLDSTTVVDWSTGEVAFDEQSVRAAAEELQRSTSFAVGSTFPDDLTATLGGGLAVLDAERQDVVPWRSLRDPVTVGRLSEKRLTALGVSLVDPALARTEIGARFPSAPPTLTTETTALLIENLRTRRITDTVIQSQNRLATLLPARTGGTSDSLSAGSADRLAIVDLVQQFLTEDVPLLAPTQISWTVGPGILLEERGARRLVSILRGGSLPQLATALTAAGAAGTIGAGVAAAVAAVGGWWVLIALVCVLIFSGWLEAVITPRGAGIHFPWWAGFGPIPFGR